MITDKIQHPLETDEYYHETVPKDAIFLHHTGGGYRPDWTVGGWERDTTETGAVKHAATAYVIGGPWDGSTKDNNYWEGKIVACMPPEKWAHHLGTKAEHDRFLNKKSIGIELCNYGPLRMDANGNLYNHANYYFSDDLVIDLGFEYRGHRYYHKYSEKQLESARKLILELADRFEIDVKSGLQALINASEETMPKLGRAQYQDWLNRLRLPGLNGQPLVIDGVFGVNTDYAMDTYYRMTNNGPAAAFDFNQAALNGAGGLWSHSNVRKDKFDLSPQPLLIEMIKSL